jgi:hypothetical protein
LLSAEELANTQMAAVATALARPIMTRAESRAVRVPIVADDAEETEADPATP